MTGEFFKRLVPFSLLMPLLLATGCEPPRKGKIVVRMEDGHVVFDSVSPEMGPIICPPNELTVIQEGSNRTMWHVGIRRGESVQVSEAPTDTTDAAPQGGNDAEPAAEPPADGNSSANAQNAAKPSICGKLLPLRYGQLPRGHNIRQEPVRLEPGVYSVEVLRLEGGSFRPRWQARFRLAGSNGGMIVEEMELPE